ncbi:hemin import ATP-binding protein HmuV [Jannaschia pagri]|uniref:Hemin import ATP-binding protein HmuV n=1 Tax=Jannaschia pagri TaxID=2829797 RepID=A0ABQ4NRP9_9RHOB|nr:MULTISPECIES: heme ABC transporter ATP-binding protein [unclassified Jannaschia]GIT93197.1 hemin import ATP-binding protein HmuV [Jannaschia sp. AI_61]GIT97036.1 hemin import ATP-binding protein HmuV [Jannaschia sp. AI_62]
MSLVVRNLTARLGRTEVLHRVGLTAQAGEVTAIVGPNGSGKSTLLRCLTGDLSFSGDVLLNGRDPRTIPGWELATLRAVLPQASALAFPFTALEVVRIGLEARGSADRTGIAQAVLARVGLAGFEGRFYQELSGGEQARVQLARVLAQVWHPVPGGAPRWLFLDEPVAALDIAHQRVVTDIARAFAAEGGGVVAVMHDLNLTAGFAHRMVLLAEGRVRAEGPPDTVMTDALLSAAYGCEIRVGVIPSTPFLLPQMPDRQPPLR